MYGSIAGGDPGVLSLIYLRGSNDDPSTSQNWYVEMARVTGADSAAPQVVRTRPLCPYPQVARYSGQGSIDDASNFRCMAP